MPGIPPALASLFADPSKLGPAEYSLLQFYEKQLKAATEPQKKATAAAAAASSGAGGRGASASPAASSTNSTASSTVSKVNILRNIERHTGRPVRAISGGWLCAKD